MALPLWRNLWRKRKPKPLRNPMPDCLTVAESNKRFPLGNCKCGTLTRGRNKDGKPWCAPCQVDAQRAADKAAGIPFEPFPQMVSLRGRHEFYNEHNEKLSSSSAS